jgi:hypothetical protein
MPGKNLRDFAPLRLLIGSEDVTFLLDNGATFASSDPGGYESASFSVPKDLPQVLRGQHILLTSGLATAFEGRVSQVQRSLGARTSIQCEGYGALFKDNKASMVFVGRDLSAWRGPSLQRQINTTGTYSISSGQLAADPTNNTPGLAQIVTDSWTTILPLIENWYDAGPNNLIAKVWYDRVYGGQVTTGQAWADAIVLSSDAVATANESTVNLYNSGSLAEISGYFTPATPYRYAIAQHYYTTQNAGAMGNSYPIYWHNLAVYGNHGLTGRGTDPVGFYPSDIFGWTLAQVPGLQAGVVQQTDASGYIVPHSAYYTPVLLDQIVTDMALIQGWHWGVWESLSPLTGNTLPRADFRPRPAAGAFTASCRRSDCSTLDIREDLGQQYNAAVVNYQQVDGTPGSVTVTADNPILDQAGITSRTVIFNGGLMTPATAQLFGQEALAMVNAQARVAGTIELTAAIDGPGAPWLLKPGIDRVRVVDLPSTDAFGAYNDVPFSRMECSVSSSGITTSLEVGLGGASLVEVLQARLQAATQLAGNGGG